MDEFQFINSIKQGSYAQSSLQKGIGDDAAVFRPTSDDIVTAVDTFVENIHFSEKTMEPFHIGYRALAANISDMAAMGAVPRFYLVSIVVPDSYKPHIHDIFNGMKTIAKEYDMDLIGGDTVSGKELCLSVTVIGSVVREKARYRSDARENDHIFVTGTLGDSRVGLEILTQELEAIASDYFIHRHCMPEPRVAFAHALKNINRLALNDISDGIANELAEIAVASGVDLIICDEQIPVHPGFKQFSQNDQYNWKYFGGEDFELVGTVPDSDWDFVQQKAAELDIAVTKIGKVLPKQGKNHQVFINKFGKATPLLKHGYTHLK
jgi:thiamine-monophosphate kinase